MKLINIIKQLSGIERFKVKSTNTINNHTEVITTDGREYDVFTDLKSGEDYASKIFEHYEDDPDMLTQLRWVNKSVNQYAMDIIAENGIQSIISYDKHHKVELDKEAVAFRTI